MGLKVQKPSLQLLAAVSTVATTVTAKTPVSKNLQATAINKASINSNLKLAVSHKTSLPTLTGTIATIQAQERSL